MIQIMTALDTDHVRHKAIVIDHARYTVINDKDHEDTLYRSYKA